MGNREFDEDECGPADACVAPAVGRRPMMAMGYVCV
jgi:hypothetical protein